MIYIRRKQLFLPSECLATRSSMYSVKGFLQIKSHLFFQGLVSFHGQGATKVWLWFFSYSSPQPYFRPFPPPLCPAFFHPSQSPLEMVIQLLLCTVTLLHSFWWQFTVSFNFHFYNSCFFPELLSILAATLARDPNCDVNSTQTKSDFGGQFFGSLLSVVYFWKKLNEIIYAAAPSTTFC